MLNYKIGIIVAEDATEVNDAGFYCYDVDNRTGGDFNSCKGRQLEDCLDRVFTGALPSRQPNRAARPKFAFPSGETAARDESFRMIVPPDIWGKAACVRFSNVFGTKPLTIDAAYAGVQMSGAALLPGSNEAMTFAGKSEVTIPAG